MIIEVTDEVEIGHNQYCGGSTKVSVKILNCANDNDIERQIEYQILDCIDTLDHSMIIDDEEAKKFYQRYYIVEKNLRYSFHNMVAVILYHRLYDYIAENYNIEITVEFGKVKCTYNGDELAVAWIKEMF